MTYEKCFAKYDTLTETEVWVFVGVAAFLAVVHMVMVRRSSDGGRFGVPMPMENLSLAVGNKRFLYCLVYGGGTSGILSLIIGHSVLGKDTDAFIDIFLKIMSFSLIGLIYYPIFISITTASSLIGSLTGFLYTISFLASKIAFIAGCDEKTFAAASTMANLPAFLCLGFVAGYLLFNFCRTLRRGLLGQGWVIEPEHRDPILEGDEEIWQVEHVRRLLSRVGTVPEVALTWRRRLRLQVHDPQQPFRYSMRTLIALSMSICLIYYILIIAIISMIVYFADMRSHIIYNWFVVSAFCGAILAGIFSIAEMFFIAKHYRRDMLLMYRGQHNSQKDRVPHAKLRFKAQPPLHFTMYAGSQAAMCAMGFLYKWLLMTIICLFIALFIVVGQLSGSKEGAKFFFNFVSPLVASGLLFLGQLIMVYFVFMIDRGRRTLAINNRRLYSNFAYFMFFWNMMIGFITALLRVAISFLFSSLMVSRLSTPVVLTGYEFLDQGYSLYKGYLHMENELTNPSLVVFSRLLLASNGLVRGHPGFKGDDALPDQAASFASIASPVKSYGAVSSALFRVSRRAKNRWLVAVTMLRNPSVVGTRRGDCYRDDSQADGDAAASAAPSLQFGKIRYHADGDVEAMPRASAYQVNPDADADADDIELIA